jgi:hypothetical protein
MRIALIAITALCVAGTVAEAAPRRSRYADDIVVTKRSYFDAGVLVKPGTLGSTNYVYASQNSIPPYANINSKFGGETLPSRWYLPNCCDVPLSRFAND